jgi:thiol-disulfide isomerase/thioredoxin
MIHTTFNIQTRRKLTLLGVGAVVLFAWSGALASVGPIFKTLDGAPLPISTGGRPTVVAFWRADCGPCLMELRNARAYVKAASPGRFLFVGLQPGGDLKKAVEIAGAPLGLPAQAVGATSAVLTTYGGAPPRLPLSVAFRGDGSVCAHHTGLLGTDQVQSWAKICGAPHAIR